MARPKMVKSNSRSALPQRHVVHNSQGLVDNRLALIQKSASQCVEEPDSTVDFEKGNICFIQMEQGRGLPSVTHVESELLPV